jgi:NAD(P)-dependent dehydrogenase (short-subunit alcohol dehydrogenase family)
MPLLVENGDAEAGEIEALGIGMDVSDEASVKAGFAKIKEKFGRVDVSARCKLIVIGALPAIRDGSCA